MSKFRTDPGEAHREFENLINNLASCVSLEDVEEKSRLLKVKNEFVNYNGNILSTNISSMMEKLFTITDLDNKLKELNELEKSNDGQAWRPQACDISSFEGEHLKKQIKAMKNYLNTLTKESMELQDELKIFRSQIQEQHNELSNYLSSEYQVE